MLLLEVAKNQPHLQVHNATCKLSRKTQILEKNIFILKPQKCHVTSSLASHVTVSLASHVTVSLASHVTVPLASHVTVPLASHVTVSLASHVTVH